MVAALSPVISSAFSMASTFSLPSVSLGMPAHADAAKHRIMMRSVRKRAKAGGMVCIRGPYKPADSTARAKIALPEAMIWFRPLLGPTLWFLLGFAVLAGLGVWQIQRLHEKEALIARVETGMRAAPVPLGDV